MAEHHPAQSDSGMDYAEHQKTYLLFTSMVKYISISIIVLLILMAFFLVH
jgi:hypothetical protein